MPKSSRHTRRAHQPNLPPGVTLRSRTDRLWQDAAWPGRDESTQLRDLDRLVAGVKPQAFLPVLLRAALAAPAPAQSRLNSILPRWLAARGYLDTLARLVANELPEPADSALAWAWLAEAGTDVSALRKETVFDEFYAAFYQGNRFQAMLTLFWYRDRRQARVQGLNFLLDFNPPWEGSVKDIMDIRPLRPDQAIAEYIHGLPDLDLPEVSFGSVEAKRRILEALIHNREEGIRLPADLIASRQAFVEHILTLPDGPDTPSFTAADFDELARSGKTPESIRLVERRMGGITRLSDGQEIRILDLRSEFSE